MPDQIEAAIPYASDDFCRLDLYRPAAENFPTVVYFHGGGMTSGVREVPEPLKNRGWGVAAASYRLHPDVRHPTYIEDAAAAVAWVIKNIARYGGDPTRVVVSGASAGAYLAAMIGLDRKYLAAHGLNPDALRGVLPLSGGMMTHMTIRLEQGITPHETRITADEYAPIFHARPDAPPMLCVTGDWHLDLWARAQENAFFVALMKVVGHPDIEHVVIPGKGHEAKDPTFWAAAMPFLERCLAC